VSLWEDCRAEILQGSPRNDGAVWKKKALMRSLRKYPLSQLDKSLRCTSDKSQCDGRIINWLLASLNQFIHSDPCRALPDNEKQELHDIIAARIQNLTSLPNSARLRQPFDDLGLPLNAGENDAMEAVGRQLQIDLPVSISSSQSRCSESSLVQSCGRPRGTKPFGHLE
jgi:hypothetical protein